MYTLTNLTEYIPLKLLTQLTQVAKETNIKKITRHT